MGVCDEAEGWSAGIKPEFVGECQDISPVAIPYKVANKPVVQGQLQDPEFFSHPRHRSRRPSDQPKGHLPPDWNRPRCGH